MLMLYKIFCNFNMKKIKFLIDVFFFIIFLAIYYINILQFYYLKNQVL